MAATPDAGPQDALEVVSRSIAPLRGCPTSPGGGTVRLPSIRPSVRPSVFSASGVVLGTRPTFSPSCIVSSFLTSFLSVKAALQAVVQEEGPRRPLFPESVGTQPATPCPARGRAWRGMRGRARQLRNAGVDAAGAGEEHPPPP